jgi:hypothetical protein
MRECRYIAPPFLTSTLDGCERSISRPDHFTHGKRWRLKRIKKKKKASSVWAYQEIVEVYSDPG